MKKIYKYPIEIQSEQIVLLPTGAKILTVQSQGEKACLWAIVNPTMPNDMAITLRIIGTGHTITDSDKLEYIGTIQLCGGALVFHVFRVL